MRQPKPQAYTYSRDGSGLAVLAPAHPGSSAFQRLLGLPRRNLQPHVLNPYPAARCSGRPCLSHLSYLQARCQAVSPRRDHWTVHQAVLRC